MDHRYTKSREFLFVCVLGQIQEDGRTGARTTGKVCKRGISRIVAVVSVLVQVSCVCRCLSVCLSSACHPDYSKIYKMLQKGRRCDRRQPVIFSGSLVVNF